MQTWMDKPGSLEDFLDEADGVAALQEAARFTGDLSVLLHIPFSYLLQDEAMIPPESLRFFYLDELWLDALVTGALSVGSVGKTQRRLNASLFPRLRAEGDVSARQRRVRRMHPNHQSHRLQQLAARADSANQPPARTGFLLRSAVVRCWRGIEIRGFDSKKAELLKLRLDQLSDEILLCVFEGEISTFSICEPAEDLHFGVKADDGRTLQVRSIAEGSLGENRGSMQLPVADNGRLDVWALKTQLEETLRNELEGQPLESSHVAFQMLSVADSFEAKRGDTV